MNFKEDFEMIDAAREINTYIGTGGIVPSIRNQISVSSLRAPELRGPINTFTTSQSTPSVSVTTKAPPVY